VVSTQKRTVRQRWPWPVLVVRTPMASRTWCQNYQDEFLFDFAVLTPRTAVVWPLGCPGNSLDGLEQRLQRQDLPVVRHDGGYQERKEVARRRGRPTGIRIRRMRVCEGTKPRVVF
jgi:hypothetical protein